MKIDQLFQFVAVVKKGSINRAATDLYISQSSLSRSIKLLEQDLGAPLFMRTSQGVVLTPFGSEVYDVAERVCTDYERLASLHPPKSESVVKMRISSHSLTFVEHAFVETYKKYEVNNPQFSLVQTTIAQSTYDVKSGLSDVGISMCTSSSIHLTERLMKASNLEYSPICRLPMVAMVGVNHPLLKNGRKCVSLSELSKYPFASGEGNFEVSELLAILQSQKPKKNTIHISDKSAVDTLLYETDAYSLIPSGESCKVPIRRYNTDLVTTIPLPDTSRFFEIGWFKRREQVLSACCIDFISVLESMF